MEPGKAAPIHSQVKAQTGEQRLILLLLFLQLGPQRRLGHTVEVLAGIEPFEQLAKVRQTPEIKGGCLSHCAKIPWG
ncbi:hypothetical protein D3C85_1558950 [compost metagenome]